MKGKANKAQDVANFITANWLLIIVIAVVILYWKTIKAFISSLLNPIKAATDILNSPSEFIKYANQVPINTLHDMVLQTLTEICNTTNWTQEGQDTINSQTALSTSEKQNLIALLQVPKGTDAILSNAGAIVGLVGSLNNTGENAVGSL